MFRDTTLRGYFNRVQQLKYSSNLMHQLALTISTEICNGIRFFIT